MARVLLGLTAMLLTAASNGGATSASDGGATAAFDTLRLSAEIARAGEAAHDPLLLIAAARLRARAGTQDDPRGGEWLARASAIGGDDPRIASLVADLRAETRKGRSAGPRVTQALIGGGRQHSFVETFRAGQPAVVYIEGDGDTNLTLRVGTACRDIRPGDVKICAWTPVKSEVVRVEIGNAGKVDNRVILGTN